MLITTHWKRTFSYEHHPEHKAGLQRTSRSEWRNCWGRRWPWAAPQWTLRPSAGGWAPPLESACSYTPSTAAAWTHKEREMNSFSSLMTQMKGESTITNSNQVIKCNWTFWYTEILLWCIIYFYNNHWFPSFHRIPLTTNRIHTGTHLCLFCNMLYPCKMN